MLITISSGVEINLLRVFIELPWASGNLAVLTGHDEGGAGGGGDGGHLVGGVAEIEACVCGGRPVNH